MKPRAIALAVALAVVSLPVFAEQPPADATENILAIRLDGREVLGTAVLQQSADGDVWIDVADWASMPGLKLELAGKTGLLSARSLGLEPEFLSAQQAINLTVPATLRPEQSLGRRLSRLTQVNAQPKGVLLNYDLAGRVNDQGQWRASVGHDARVGVGAATLSTMGQLNHSPAGTTYTRSLTTLTYDDLPRGIAYQAGDVFTPRTNLGSAVNLAGIRIGSDRALRRDVNFLPVPVLGGMVQDASTAELFVNGRKSGQHSLKAGPWEVDQYPVSPGSNAVRVVVRDDFGREEVLEDSFYLAPNNLPKGITEWDVAAGLVREGGDDYATPAVSAKVDRGVSDAWTMGVSLEATDEGRAAAFSNRLVLGTAGTLALDVGASSSPGGSGTALAVAYDYQGQDFSVHAGHSRFDESHWSLAQARGDVFALGSRRLVESTAVSGSYRPRGSQWSASLGAAQLTYADGTTRQRFDLGARYRSRDHSYGLGVSHTRVDGVMGYVSYRTTLGSGTSLTATARRAPEPQFDALLMGRGQVGDRAIQWTAGARHEGSDTRAWGRANTSTPKGPLSLEVDHSHRGTDVGGRFQSSVWLGEGGITTQGPARGSFLLVDLAGQAGVPVSAGGSGGGTTNRRGVAVLPNVQPLVEHAVTVDGSSVSLDVAIENTTLPAVAGRRAGAKVVFEVLTETMIELRLTHNGAPIDPPAAVVSDTERALVGKGGVAVLMAPQPGQVLTVNLAGGGACSAQLPQVLPGYDTPLSLSCEATP